MLGIFLSAPAWAAPTLKIVSPPKKIAVGEAFTFQIKLEWPTSEGLYEIQAESPLFENFVLLDQGQSEETGPEGIQAVITLQLRAVKPGEGRILPFEVRYRKPGTEPWQSFPVAGQKVLIVRPFPRKTIVAVLLALSGVGIAGWSAVAFIKNRREVRRKKTARPPDPKQRVYAHAEETIMTYKGETQKETVSHWADQIKEVVAARYDIPSRVSTGSEILAALQSKQLATAELAEVKRLLREIEQLKFTPGSLTIREMETLQKTLLQYVRGKIIIEK